MQSLVDTYFPNGSLEIYVEVGDNTDYLDDWQLNLKLYIMEEPLLKVLYLNEDGSKGYIICWESEFNAKTAELDWYEVIRV